MSASAPRDGPTGGSAEAGKGMAPTFEIEKMQRKPGEPPIGSPQATVMGPGASGAAAMAANGGTQTPLDVDRLEEVRSTRGREPISIEIVRRASRIRDLETIRDAMVVYCDLATAPLVIAGLAHGANQARLFPDVQTTSDYAEEHFRFPTQRIVGGAIPAVDPDTTDRVPLTPEELSATTAAFNQAQTELQTADKEVGRLSRMEASLQKSFASPSQSLGRLVNPARSTAALKKRQANAALAAATAGAAHARLGKLVETSSKPREPLSAEVAKGWRQPIATEFHELMTNRALLLSAPTALDALEPVFGAKRLVLCGFGNLDSVRERVLAWWSSVSTIDAEQHPDINTRVVLVCGPESAERPVSTSAVDADGRPLFLTVNVAVPQGAEAGNIIEIAANGGVKMSVTIPDGLGVGDSFPVDVPIPKEEEPTANPNGFTNNKQHLFEEAEPELPAAELLAGLLLFQLMQCADVEIEDLSPDGATRHCLRAIINASRAEEESEGEGWNPLAATLEQQLRRVGLADTTADVAELSVTGQYTAVPLFAPRDGAFTADPLAGMSLDLRFDESVRHKL